MNKVALVEQLELLVSPVVTDLGFELVDLAFAQEGGRQILRLRIDRLPGSTVEGGVTIDDCAKVSRALSGVLDVEAEIPLRYTLEVSSPGINRPLRKPADFERFSGSAVEIKTREPIEGRRNFRGELAGLQENEVLVTIDHVLHRIPVDAIAKANLRSK